MSREIKDFKDVKRGDIAEDMYENKYTVLAKAVGKDFHKKLLPFDDNGGMQEYVDRGAEDFDMDQSEIDATEMIAVKDEDGTNCVYVYDYDGCVVYK